ncbi:helix-turn-helix domain-containing protein [Selenomonas ruminantium]|uniref:helix-turn-helix domain-containing protein n=1 Tax=Selenomonas ruminantium TaxID=971 RepID=UPI00040B5336|nr:helix-turn-helix transcriptional regulator [Selenomonas ruminantium]
MDNVNVGYYIRQRRIELGLTQIQLAQKIGKSSQVISNWERGYSPSMKMGELASIAQALQVNVNYFFPAPNNQMDKRLQYVIKNYPQLTEHSKNIIDAIIRSDKKTQKQPQKNAL